MNPTCEDDFIGALPVLDPPPGFGDDLNTFTEDHYYDDPYSEDEDPPPKSILNSRAVSKFASHLARSLLAAVVMKPGKVKMRAKKPSTGAAPSSCILQDPDLYSVPIDNLTPGGSNKGNPAASRKQMQPNRHSIAVPRAGACNEEPVHMTLDEVRSYLREIQDTSCRRPWMLTPSKSVESSTSESKRKSCFVWTPHLVATKHNSFDDARTKRSRKSLSVTAAGIKQALFSVFRLSGHPSSHQSSHLHYHPQNEDSSRNNICPTGWTFSMPEKAHHEQYLTETSPHQRRALPPLPPEEPVGFVRVPSRFVSPAIQPREIHQEIEHLDLAGSADCLETSASSGNCLPEGVISPVDKQSNLDFAASIEAVKDHGWYWGPLSGDAAEQILSEEPDGSFLVRDSSDDHYIFSLSFKLNGGVRHVRIEHDHGKSYLSTSSAKVYLSFPSLICRQFQLRKRGPIPQPDHG